MPALNKRIQSDGAAAQVVDAGGSISRSCPTDSSGGTVGDTAKSDGDVFGSSHIFR